MDTSNWRHTGSMTGQTNPVQQAVPQTGEYVPPANAGEAAYPFEEPEEAPELRSARSENLYSRSEPFWNRVYEMPREGEEYPRDPNYWNHPERLADDHLLEVDPKGKAGTFRSFLGSGVLKKVLVIVAVLLVIGGILYSALFEVRTITVHGNSTVSTEEIIRLSGLSVGMNTMAVDDAAVAGRIERNRYLQCTLVDVKWDSVAIHVRERVPAVYLNHNGMVMVLDNRGWVLEEYMDAPSNLNGLIFVTGMNVRHCVPGQAITLANTTQLPALTEILVELKAMKGLDLIRELDMSSMDSIYLATTDGFDVRLGNQDRIHEKLRAMMVVRLYLLDEGYEGGTIDVSDPERPTYAPADGAGV